MIIRILFLLLVPILLFAQGDPIEKAEFHFQQGNKSFDSGLYEDALIQYEMALESDPSKIEYPYSVALTYYQMKEYKKASQILDSLSNLDDAFVQIFQLLGNSQDFQGKNEQAIQSYIRGLDKFPNSGRLYMEIGLVELNQSDTIKALGFWEQALKVEPDFTHMYYRLTKFYDLVDDDLLTIFYGEIYLNLTTNIEYFRDINKLVYDTYNEILTLGDDGKFFADIGMYYRPTIDSEYRKQVCLFP
jgi:tetratricopeptide (TPR) repeat protein